MGIVGPPLICCGEEHSLDARRYLAARQDSGYAWPAWPRRRLQTANTVVGPSLTKVDTGERDSQSLVTGGAYGRGVHAKSFATQDA